MAVSVRRPSHVPAVMSSALPGRRCRLPGRQAASLLHRDVNLVPHRGAVQAATLDIDDATEHVATEQEREAAENRLIARKTAMSPV